MLSVLICANMDEPEGGAIAGNWKVREVKML
jgi:hypothetical protein